jgi:predicted transcriptional regulator
MLGKDARRRIIGVLLESRSYREAAELLGVTPAAIAKYMSGRTHPSDRVVLRALRVAAPEERREIAQIIVEEFMEGLESLVDWLLEEGIVDRRLARGLEEAAAKLRLASVKRGLLSL